MITFACVLRTGGDYEPAHVQALRDGVARNLRAPHRFVCLTDHPRVGGDTLPLRMGWPGWWSKIELFDGRLRGPVVYADLDTIVVGALDDMVLGHQFTVLTNFWAEDRIGSGLMAWSVDLRSIFDKFCEAPDQHIATYRTTERWGDQGFVRFNSPVELGRWQAKHPGKVVSFKRDVRRAKVVPAAARVVCFHGPPRPWQMNGVERGWFRARGVSAKVQLASA